MSAPANKRRYLVTAFDFSKYEIAVEAFDERDAVNKAQAIYGFHGSYEEFERVDITVRWNAVQLIDEVLS